MARPGEPDAVWMTRGNSGPSARGATPRRSKPVIPNAVQDVDPDTEPPANYGLLAFAAVLLVIPIVALVWVSSYAREEPALGGFPFFIWYQFAWIFVTSAVTWVAHQIVRVARPHRPLGRAGSVRRPPSAP